MDLEGDTGGSMYVPVWLQQRPGELAEEIVKGYLRSIIDFSLHSGRFAMAALAQRLTYLG